MKTLFAVALRLGMAVASGAMFAQTHTFPALDTNNTFTGPNTFQAPLNVGATDTALSRTVAGTIAVGNGNQGDGSGSLILQNITSPALGTANAAANFGSGSFTFGGSLWNGSTALSTPASVGYGPGGGTNPNLFWVLSFPSTMPGGSFMQIFNSKPATSVANVSSPIVQLLGNSWTGSASQIDTVLIQDVLGGGANPSNTLQLSHFGNAGGFAVQVANGVFQLGNSDTGLSRTAAGQIALGNGTQGDASGQLQLTNLKGTAAAGLNLSDSAGVSHFAFGASPSVNTFLSGNGSGVIFLGSANKMWVPDSGGLLVYGATAGSADTGLSRIGNAQLAIGNGTQGDASGSLNTTRVLLANGGAASPAYSFGNDLSTGIYRAVAGVLNFASSGTTSLLVGNSVVRAGSGYTIGFSSNSDPSLATTDTAISRLAGGSLAVGNGTQGDASGTLKATTVNAVSGFQVNGAALAASNLSNGVTGSGAIVLGTSPAISTPTLASPTFTGTASGNATIPPTMLNSTTGSGAVVLATSPSLTTPSISSPATTGTDSGTETLTNKRVTPRVVSLADGTSFTMTSDTADMNTQVNTQVAGTLTANAPTGTPTDGQKLMLRIKSTNVQTYAWNAIFRGSSTSPLPTQTTGSVASIPKTDYIGFIFNAADSKWDCIAVDMGH